MIIVYNLVHLFEQGTDVGVDLQILRVPARILP